MVRIASIKWAYSLFGLRRFIFIAVAWTLGKRWSMTMRAPGILHPVRLRAGMRDTFLYDSILLKHEYEWELPSEPKVIVDVGANVGLTSVYFANRYPSARIFAIEPEGNNFRMLEENIRPYSNIKAVRAALWHEDTRLGLRDPGIGSHGFQVEESGNGLVPAITFPALLAREGITHVDLLKVDIEGAEKEVFSGRPDWVSTIDFAIIELHDRYKPGCSESVHTAMADFEARTRGELTYFMRVPMA